MQLKTETRDIAGVTVRTTQLPAMKAYVLLGRLSRSAAPALAASSAINPADLASLLAPLAHVFARLEAEELESLALETLAGSTAIVDGPNGKVQIELTSVDKINAAFSGKISALLGAMKFAIEVNYDDFFGAARELLKGLLLGETTAASESPSDSTPT